MAAGSSDEVLELPLLRHRPLGDLKAGSSFLDPDT
ncbi:MAG: hypothetical protein ACJAYU_004996, partial [Bradymonadia bacterium]